MAESKDKDFRIFLESSDGKANRTIELQAKDKAAARKVAEEQAAAIAEEHGGDAYEVKTVEAI